MDKPTTDTESLLLNDLFKLTNSLLAESERAVVIIAAARLDADLEALLSHILMPHPGGHDPMFEGDRMLGTFSAKIGMAYRLGAIDADFERALQILRKIRNDFAHQLDSETLSSERQRPRLAMLVRWCEKSEIFKRGMATDVQGEKSHAHLQFVFCTIVMVVLLHSGLTTLRRVNPGQPLSMVMMNLALQHIIYMQGQG